MHKDNSNDIHKIAGRITPDPDIIINEDDNMGVGGGDSVEWEMTDMEIENPQTGEVESVKATFDVTVQLVRGTQPSWGYHGGDPGEPDYVEVVNVEVTSLEGDQAPLTTSPTPEMIEEVIAYFHRYAEDSREFQQHALERLTGY